MSPLPTPNPPPLSPQAEIALRAIAGIQQLPLAELYVVYEEALHFPTLDRTYQSVVMVHPPTERFFNPLVDPITGAVEPDVQAVYQAERAAHLARYGTLHPDLYARLQKAADDERLPVAIWIASGEQERQPDELVAEVAQIYPEAEEAFQKHGAPWAVDDPALAEAIRSAYIEHMQRDVAARVDPLLRWLAEQGHEAKAVSSVPAVATTLTRAEIEKAAKHPLIGEVYLLEDESAPAADIATATSRFSAAWQQGVHGNGIRIAIVEGEDGGTNINATAASCLNIAATMNASYPDLGHISRVAAIASCNNSTLPGAARGATILDGGFDHTNNSGQAFADALVWAVQTQNANVVNVSWSTWPTDNPTSTQLQFTDRVADYWVRSLWKTVVVAAGNTVRPHGTTVSSPGKGFNVLTVGNINDSNTARWSDDAINNTSSHVNPATGVEKPEVAAPGTNINTVAGQGTGTSYAAPQVAGLAALMMQRNNDLRYFPSAVKAIIMASAVHNVEGDRSLSDRDGAGSIDAALAVNAAGTRATGTSCAQPCWWGIEPAGAPTPNGGHIDRFISVKQGERIRIVSSWLSVVAGPSSGYFIDALAINYNLHVYLPSQNPSSGPSHFSSASATSNSEIVEFVAPETGNYRVRIHRASDDPDNANRLGIAWTRTRTVYHDIWRGDQGWSRSIPTLEDQPQWGSATAWSGPWASTALPGSWTLQMQCDYVVGSVLRQNIWRGNQGWSRTVPIFNGAIQWGFASNWSGPFSITALPGSGALQAQSDYVINNTLHQNFWRGNQAWLRTVPIVNGVEQWANASAWSGPFAITALPGSGDMQMTADYVIDNSLHQEFWRGNQGYRRTVPIVGSTPQWNSASAWSTPLTTGSLAGSGSLQALNFYVLP